MDTDSPIRSLRLAVECIGSQSAMARLLGTTQASVWRWLNVTRQLPAEHVLTIERETRISRHDLRPDIYPRDEARRADEPAPSMVPAR